MKPKKLLTGILVVAAFAAGIVASTCAAPMAVITSQEFVIRGEVTSRTPIELTIVTPDSSVVRVQVTDTTPITKAGLSLKPKDVMVGDKVTATVMRGGDEKLQAVRVTVQVGNE
jgi:hypothetical protein